MIYLHYSNIYDMNLARWRAAIWKYDDEVQGKKYASELQSKWDINEERVTDFLQQMGFIFPSIINGYIVSPWDEITAFSDPLTIPMYKNLNVAIVKIIHELIHIALSYRKNEKIKNEIYTRIAEKFEKESYPVRIHIAVNLIQEATTRCIPNLLPLLEKEKHVSKNLYPGQERAWQLLKRLGLDRDIFDPIATLVSL